jgi:Holliday junction DNA helicase RuvA
MINYLKGILIEKHPPTLVVEVNNSIGYVLEASMQTFYQLPDINQNIFIYTCLLVREDKQWLYGFIQPDERTLFQELLKVNKIGPKAALAILSNMDVQTLWQSITHQDVRALQNIPGIGRKTAERLLLELSNRVSQWKPQALQEQERVTNHSTSSDTSAYYTVQRDAMSALISLGYKPQTATHVIHSLKDPTLSTEQLIRLALAKLMQG